MTELKTKSQQVVIECRVCVAIAKLGLSPELHDGFVCLKTWQPPKRVNNVIVFPGRAA